MYRPVLALAFVALAVSKIHGTDVQKYAVQDYAQINKFLSEVSDIGNISLSTNDTCELCDTTMNNILKMAGILPKSIVRSIVSAGCTLFHFQDQRVCDGLVGPDLDIVTYIKNNGKNVSGEKFCTLLEKTVACHNQFDYFNWTIDIPPKPDVIREKIVNKNAKNLRILQLTDLHYDPRYTSGAKAICGEPICCQDDQGTPDNPDEACGIWGDYRQADTSRKTFLEVLRHTKTQNFDYVYFTGDIIPHRVWSTSSENNSKLEREVMDLMKSNYDVPVIFVLGNHEAHPFNAYAPIDVTNGTLSTHWLFQQLTDELKGLVSDEDLKNIDKGGFYTTVLKPGFRIVILNNNVCYTDNLWLAYADYDTYGQLAWLVKVLEKAEQDGEYVHILHHIPTGDQFCLGTWGREFNRIVNRFADTISGQFNGHTHLDEFFLYFKESDLHDAIHVAFNGASIATFTDNNPSYKIYDIDSHTFEVSDVEEWTFNLTAANLEPEKETVDWYKLYSFKETFGISSMKPKEIGEMVKEMAKNRTLLEIYNKYRYRMGDGADAKCDDDCHKQNLCRIVTSSLADTEHCEEIKKIYNGN